jgi:hypothetical protein
MRLAGVALFAVVLGACGGASKASLERSADATGEETSRVEITSRFADRERHYVFNAAGAFDYPNERGVMTTSSTVPFYGKGVELREFRLLDNVGYTRWVVRGKTYWLKQDPVEKSGDPADVLIPSPGTPTKPTDVLSRVLLASVENQELGKEDIRGTETTHHRARVDLTKLVKQLPPAERPEADLQRFWGERFVPVDLWIDGESRLRRITIARRGVGNNDTAEQTMTVDLFDYGVDVVVQPPPADETISQGAFDEIVGPVLETGEPESDAGEEVCEASPDPKTRDRECRELKTP